jgi:hypothetical protein
MSTLMIVLILAMLLWSVGFVVVGIVLAEEVLWRRPAGKAAPPVSWTRKVGAMGLLAIGGILVVTAIVAGVLMAEREVHFVHLESRLGDLEHRLGQEHAGTPRPPAESR